MSRGYSCDMSLFKEISTSNFKGAGNRTPKENITISYMIIKKKKIRDQKSKHELVSLPSQGKTGDGSPWETGLHF